LVYAPKNRPGNISSDPTFAKLGSFCNMANEYRIGICISGGGANGAFAAGVIDVLYKTGLRVAAISGCSVGGLLASAWSVGAVEEVTNLLVDRGRDRLLPHARSLRYIPLICVATLLLPFIVFQQSLHRSKAILDSLSRKRQRVHNIAISFMCFAHAEASNLLLFFLLARYDLLNREDDIKILLFSFVMPLTVSWFLYDRLRTLDNELLANPTTGAAQLPDRISLFLLYMPIPLFSFRVAKHPLLSAAIGVFALFLLYGLLIAFLRKLALVLFKSATIFSNSQLRKEITGILLNRTFSMPTYVVAASTHRLHDPDNPNWQVEADYGGMGHFELLPVFSEVPTYFNLMSKLDEETKVKVLLATAAIPGGILPAVEIDGTAFRDGMVVDNVPLFPLVYYEGCDIILVISNSIAAPNSDQLLTKAMQIDRLLRLPLFDEQKEYGMTEAEFFSKPGEHRVNNDPPIIIGFRPPQIKIKIVTTQPDHDPGFALDFGSKKQRDLFRAGQEKARASLHEFKTMKVAPF
jgi:predicted acylesterase/phospholipase RssA